MADGGTTSAGEPPRYCAFISYNHRDKAQATWLHRSLETYRIPKRMQGRLSSFGPLGARLPPVFRDREELATSADLAQSVRAALDQAHSLIVICSPNGAKSRWVNEEIRTFKALGRTDRIQCLIVDGVPHASGTIGASESECFPPALFEGGAFEPLAADIRPGQDSRQAAKLKLLAGLLGVGYDELRRREQARRAQRLTIAASVLGAAFILMTALALFALVSRSEAVKQRDIARRKTITAERTVEFVKSLFEVSDPSEARGATITAREILDKGAVKVRTELAGEPSVKAELGTTLGEVYGGLGLYRKGEALIREGLPLRNVDRSTRARQYAALGDAQARQGDYPGALASFRQALASAGGDADTDPAAISRILADMGEALSATNDDAKSDRVLKLALKLDERRLGSGRTDVARDLEDLSVNDIDAKRFVQAGVRMKEALTLRLRYQGSMHPKVGEDLNALGAIAYFEHDPATAERYYRRSLDVETIVLGPDHPDVATIMNNIGRLMLERRDFTDAAPILEKSLNIILAERDESYDDLAFSFDNLALAKRGLGDDAAAEPLFRKALVAARRHNHRNVAPILADLADLVCSTGRVAEGEALVREAAPIMARAYADDPWRSAWVQVVEAGCLSKAGMSAAALREAGLGAPILQARWAPNTLYGARTAQLVAEASRH